MITKTILFFFSVLLALGAQAAQSDICGRSRVMVKELEFRLEKPCSEMTDADLAKIEFLDFDASTKGLENADWDDLMASDFVGLTALNSVGFDGNHLSKVKTDLFANIHGLKYVMFHWVPGLTELPDNLFDSNPELKEFYMSTDDFDGGSTPLREIPAKLFQNRPNLEAVRFLNTRLSAIPKDAFSGSAKLKSLDFGQQPNLTEITDPICRGCNSLTKINFLNSHNLKNVSVSVFEGMPSLQTVDLRQIGKLSDENKKNLLAAYPGVNFLF